MMTKLSYGVNVLVNHLVSLCSWALVLLGAVMTVVIVLQVFFRFVIYVPMPWSEELARYVMIWMGLLGSVVALRHGRHIGVRVLVERLPKGVYDHVAIFLQLVMIVFLLILAQKGWELGAINAIQLSPAMELSMQIPYLSIPVGSVLMALVLFSDMLEDRWPTPAGSHANLAATVLDEPGSSPVRQVED